MRVLFVEDNETKRSEVEAYLLETLSDIHIVAARSLHAGLGILSRERVDLILLDMSLPAFDITISEDGFQHLPFAGRDLLEYLDRFEFEIPVIVVTAFGTFGQGNGAKTRQQLDAELRHEYPDLYLGHVAYSAVTDQWRLPLTELIAASFPHLQGDD